MKKTALWFLFLTIVLIAFMSNSTLAGDDTPRVKLTTSMGEIVVALDPGAAPKTVENFLSYVKMGFYEGTIFHRVIKDFMIQGGGFNSNMQRKPTLAPVTNEADNGLSNQAGTIAMARTSDPHSAMSQFFINVKDNAFLDHRSKTEKGWGYCVFGRVISGMDVVHAIEHVPTTISAKMRDVPKTPVVIRSATLVEPAPKKATPE